MYPSAHGAMSHSRHLPFVVRLLLAAVVFATGLAFPLTAVATQAVTTTASGFTPTEPVRLVDTRVAQRGRTLGAGRTLQVKLPAQVPNDARAVVLNVTGTGASTSTYLTVWPKGSPRPATSNVNLAAGGTRANVVFVAMGKDRSVTIVNGHGTVDVLVDLMGWFTSGYTTTVPTRVMDTRVGLGGGVLGAGATRRVDIVGGARVPRSTTGVVVNVTAVDTTSTTYLTVMPSGEARPESSTVNASPGTTAANLTVVRPGRDGRLSVYNDAGFTHVIVDVLGWFADGDFRPEGPTRALDTRVDPCVVRLEPGDTRTLQLSNRLDVGAAVVNVTATGAQGTTFVTMWPTGAPRPATSTVNAADQQAVANAAVVGLGRGGFVNLYNGGASVDVVIDVLGWFAGRVDLVGSAPCDPYPLPPVSALTDRYVVGASVSKAVGVDRIAVVVCEIPHNTTDSYYSRMGRRVQVDDVAVAAWAQAHVAPHFSRMSGNRYRVEFIPAGRFVLQPPNVEQWLLRTGPGACLEQATARTRSPFTNVLATDNAAGGWFGFAGPGTMSSDPEQNLDRMKAPPARTGRGAYVTPAVLNGVGGAALADMVAHELGHTLHWPHSFVGPGSEYDNPIDLMSGAGGRDIAYTLAFNRFAAGWINDAQVSVHTRGSTRTALALPSAKGQQLILAPSAHDARLLLTLEANPAMISAGGSTGVAVHVVDQRPGCQTYGGQAGCFSLGRRQGQALGAPGSEMHVVRPGETINLEGLRITVAGFDRGELTLELSGQYRPGPQPLLERVPRTMTPSAAATVQRQGRVFVCGIPGL